MITVSRKRYQLLLWSRSQSHSLHPSLSYSSQVHRVWTQIINIWCRCVHQNPAATSTVAGWTKWAQVWRNLAPHPPIGTFPLQETPVKSHLETFTGPCSLVGWFGWGLLKLGHDDEEPSWIISLADNSSLPGSTLISPNLPPEFQIAFCCPLSPWTACSQSIMWLFLFLCEEWSCVRVYYSVSFRVLPVPSDGFCYLLAVGQSNHICGWRLLVFSPLLLVSLCPCPSCVPVFDSLSSLI